MQASKYHSLELCIPSAFFLSPLSICVCPCFPFLNRFFAPSEAYLFAKPYYGAHRHTHRVQCSQWRIGASAQQRAYILSNSYDSSFVRLSFKFAFVVVVETLSWQTDYMPHNTPYSRSLAIRLTVHRAAETHTHIARSTPVSAFALQTEIQFGFMAFNLKSGEQRRKKKPLRWCGGTRSHRTFFSFENKTTKNVAAFVVR